MIELHVSDLHEINPEEGKGPSSIVQRTARAHDADVIFYHGDNLEGVWVTEDGHNLMDSQGVVEQPTTINRFIRDNRTVLDNLTYTNDGTKPIDVYAVTGNHDGITNLKLGIHEPVGLELLEAHPDIRSLDFGKDDIKGREYGGLPGHKEIRPGGATPVEFTEKKLASELDQIGYVDHLIAHTVPAVTNVDMSFYEPLEGEVEVDGHPPYESHAGSVALRKYAMRVQPNWVTGGHIHEASGREDKLGETRLLNVAYPHHGDTRHGTGHFYRIDRDTDEIWTISVQA